jgi:hypothetical protein
MFVYFDLIQSYLEMPILETTKTLPINESPKALPETIHHLRIVPKFNSNLQYYITNYILI